jgi:hypothetical protein
MFPTYMHVHNLRTSPNILQPRQNTASYYLFPLKTQDHEDD